MLPHQQQHSRNSRKSRRGRKRSPSRVSGGQGRSLSSLAQGSGKSASLNSIVEPWMPVFQVKTYRRLRYATWNGLSSSGGAVDTHVFRVNDLFDTDVTSTGHQPMGFDQMMVFYEHFHVLEARVVCTFRNGQTNTPYVSMRVDADVSPLTNPDQIREVGGCVFDTLSASSVYGGIKTLSLKVDIAKFAGLNRQTLLASDKYAGNVAASPVEGTYVHIQTWDQSAGNIDLVFDCQIEYEVCFTEPRPLTPSLGVEVSRDPSIPNMKKITLREKVEAKTKR